MHPTRRLILGAAAAAPITLTFRSAAWAAETAQVTGVQRFDVGDAVVTALLDGHVGLEASMFSNLTAEEAASLLEQAFRSDGPVPTGVNGYLVEAGEELVLIDAGGRGFLDSLGALGKALEDAGYAKGDVSRVLITHLHPDHAGGLQQDGSPDFPSATLHLHADEQAFWTSAENRKAAGEGSAAFFDTAEAALEAYGDKVETFSEDGELLSGISAMHLPGHTPGHTGFRIGSGGDALTVWGDIVHVAAFQFAKPDASIGFDVNPEQAIETRKALFERAATEQLRIAGMHLAFPGVGRVVQDGEAYRFTAEPWTFAIE